MSLIAADMDGDGDLDVLASDRKGPGRGCYWLENPLGPIPGEAAGPSTASAATTRGDVPRPRRPRRRRPRRTSWPRPRDDGLLVFRRARTAAAAVAMGGVLHQPRARLRHGEGVSAGDLDLDGAIDLVYSCENAAGEVGRDLARRGKAGPSPPPGRPARSAAPRGSSSTSSSSSTSTRTATST